MLCAQRRSAPERACTRGGGTERVFFSITLTKRITYTGLKELRKDLEEPVGQVLTTSSIHEGPDPVTPI